MTDGWIMDQFDPDDFADCPACGGAGSLPEVVQGVVVGVDDCTRCSGTGVDLAENVK